MIHQEIISTLLSLVLILKGASKSFTGDDTDNRDIYHSRNHYGLPVIYIKRVNSIDVAKYVKDGFDYIFSGRVFSIRRLHTC